MSDSFVRNIILPPSERAEYRKYSPIFVWSHEPKGVEVSLSALPEAG